MKDNSLKAVIERIEKILSKPPDHYSTLVNSYVCVIARKELQAIFDMLTAPVVMYFEPTNRENYEAVIDAVKIEPKEPTSPSLSTVFMTSRPAESLSNKEGGKSATVIGKLILPKLPTQEPIDFAAAIAKSNAPSIVERARKLLGPKSLFSYEVWPEGHVDVWYINGVKLPGEDNHIADDRLTRLLMQERLAFRSDPDWDRGVSNASLIRGIISEVFEPVWNTTTNDSSRAAMKKVAEQINKDAMRPETQSGTFDASEPQPTFVKVNDATERHDAT
jgi:hypothetical protein